MVKTLVKIAASAAFGVVLLEAAARVLFPVALNPTTIADPILNHRERPGSEVTHTWFARAGVPPYVHRYNEHGWASPPIAAKRAGTTRIFFLGDSFVQGTCPMERSMPSVAGTRLTASGHDVEVVNAGTSSYSPVLYYLLAKTKVLALEPDVAVISVDMTDVFDDYLYGSDAVLGDDGLPVASPADGPFARTHIRNAAGVRKSTLVERAVRPFVRISRAAERVSLSLGARLNAKLPITVDAHEWCREPWSPAATERVQASMRYLTAAIQLLRNAGVHVVVTAVPRLEQLEGSWSTRPHQTVKHTAAAAGALYHDSLAALRMRAATANPRDWYIPGDMHFNERGYSVWAEGVAATISSVLGAASAPR